MRQFLVVTILLMTASLCFAQAATPSMPQTSAPDASTPAANQMPPSPTEAPVTPSSPTGPTTPSVTFGNTSPSPAGATNATLGNQAGATNSTLQPTSSNGNTSQTTYTTPSVENTANPGASETSANPPSSSRNLMGGADSAWAISNNTMGVAEAARLARAARAAHKPRVFTNADIARLRGNAPASTGDNTAPVTNEQTMPASDVQEQEQNGATMPATPSPNTQAPPATQNPSTPKSPFNAKPSPKQPR